MATAAAAPTEQELMSQLAQLRSLLTTITATRSSLPQVLRSIALPSSSSTSVVDQSTLYRLASAHVTTCIAQLGEQLKVVQDTGLLQRAEDSAREDPRGIAVREGAMGLGEQQDLGLAKLKELLGVKRDEEGEDSEELLSVKGKGKGGPPISSREELERLVQKYKSNYSRVQVLDLVGQQQQRPHELRLQLRGVLRATISLRWSKAAGGAGGHCTVERVGCWGLKEEKPTYLPSQFSLHNNIARAAMELVERSAAAASSAGRNNLEEVLTLLCDPPLPF